MKTHRWERMLGFRVVCLDCGLRQFIVDRGASSKPPRFVKRYRRGDSGRFRKGGEGECRP